MTWRSPRGRTTPVAVLIAALARSLACSRADSQRADSAPPPAGIRARGAGAARAALVPTLEGLGTGETYRTIRLEATGRITGTVEFDGPAPIDSVVHPSVDADVCGQSLVDISVEHRGPRLANAVVWLDGVTAGKSRPLVRRYEITTEGCRLIPRVQAALAGGTLDVRNADAALHRTDFLRASTDVRLASVPETEAGAVVPTRAVLAAPGLVEVRCAQHPWSRGWIFVFGQPYFTTTDVNGGFAIDSVPPGRYRLTVWHERFGARSDSVTVSAGGEARVAIRLTPARTPAL